uniref:aldehyde dehydrogenase family protein n=1 Tax=Bulleidia extructa TaxID=118748 RepID=UPI002353ADC8
MNRPEIKIQDTYGLYIGGQWLPASDGKTFKTYSPADSSFLANVAEATKEDVDQAVKAAWEGFEVWKKTTPAQRAKALNQIADIIEEHADFLALLETLDNGKPIRETKALDIPFAAEHFRYFAGVIRADEGSAVMLNETTMSLVLHEPIGVVGHI